MKTITASEAARKLGIKNVSHLHYLCDTGRIKGFKKIPAKDIHSHGKYVFHEKVSYREKYSKEYILERCLSYRLPRMKIKEVLGEDLFKQFVRSPKFKNYDYSSFMRPVFEMIKLGPR